MGGDGAALALALARQNLPQILYGNRENDGVAD
jgi:hypothetical protein